MYAQYRHIARLLQICYLGTALFYTQAHAQINTPAVTVRDVINQAKAQIDTPNGPITIYSDTVITHLTYVYADGVVFNSSNNDPLPNMEVCLVGNNDDISTPQVIKSIYTVFTDQNGQYKFPTITPGDYKILVKTTSFKFPSSRHPNLLHSRNIDFLSSYGQTFSVTNAIYNLHIDIPVDPIALPALAITKTVSKSIAEIGDILTYTVQVKNTAHDEIPDVFVKDLLPAGFKYVKKSVSLPNQPIIEPGQLSFKLGTLRSEPITFTYKVKIEATANKGININTAQAGSRDQLIGNIASARVQVEEGVLTTKSVLLGKVYVDDNQNGIQDIGELGIPGIRIYLEDGTFVITDSDGKYSIYGLRPATHVLKLDRTTLPVGAQLEALNANNAGAPDSIFVILRTAELHKANFAIYKPTAAIMQEILQRRQSNDPESATVQAKLATPLNPQEALGPVTDTKGLPATGFINSTGWTNQAQKETEPVKSTLTQNITNLDSKLGFIGLSDLQVLNHGQPHIRVKGPIGALLTLSVNSAEIPATKLGKKEEYPEKGVQSAEYLGITLPPGTNDCQVTMKDTFGNTRGKEHIRLLVPDQATTIKVILPKDSPADGKTKVNIKIRLEDKNGIPIQTKSHITLESSAGHWDIKDNDANDPGCQTIIEGDTIIALVPPTEPIDAEIRVKYNNIQTKTHLPFIPDLRPMIALGVIEGTINLTRFNSSILQPARAKDGFEEELNGWHTGARSAFFLKGKIKGSYLLTAAYDSSKPADQQLFRDIQPDQFYPVYGDAALRGYDAQSTSKLYVRIDKKRSYLLYGDFSTVATTEARGLGNYNRNLNGIREHYETDKISANVWASQDSTRQVIEELEANGTSGPYFFHVHNGIDNSERVEIITRDRNQPARILQTIPMSRYVDYEFEPFTGYLLFRAPVSSLDPELNPISIRVTYETQTDGDSFWIYGADAQAKVSKTLEVGGATIQDDNPQGHSSLNSINSTVKLTEHTSLVGEVAQSNYEDASGTAERLEIKHHKGNSDARVYYSQTGENFTNAASTIMSGRIESGFKASQKVAKSTTLVSQGILSENLYTSGETKGVIAGVVQQVGRTSVEVGARHSETTKDPNHVGLPNQPSEINSLRTKVKTPIPKIPATIYAEYENDVKDTDKRMLAIGADYQLKNKARFYARHELISTLGSPYELNSSQQQNTTVAGLETEYMRNGHVFNEYRNRDALTGRDMETATGLRNLWTLSDNLKLNTSFERISPISTGADKNEATAGALGLEYTPDAKSKATTRLEVRDAVANDTILNTIGYARKLSKDWTFLSKSIFMDQISKDINAGDRVQMRFQTGLAYRQTEQDKWNGLTKYEYRQENDQTNLKLPIDRTVHIISSDINYQPTADWELSAHYAVKLATESDAITTAHLLGGRLSYFISKKLDIGFGAYTLANLNFSQQKYAFGPELGYIIHQNLRLGIGYNIQGFKDHDLGESYTAPGVFINIRIKFGHEAIN